MLYPYSNPFEIITFPDTNLQLSVAREDGCLWVEIRPLCQQLDIEASTQVVELMGKPWARMKRFTTYRKPEEIHPFDKRSRMEMKRRASSGYYPSYYEDMFRALDVRCIASWMITMKTSRPLTMDKEVRALEKMHYRDLLETQAAMLAGEHWDDPTVKPLPVSDFLFEKGVWDPPEVRRVARKFDKAVAAAKQEMGEELLKMPMRSLSEKPKVVSGYAWFEADRQIMERVWRKNFA